MPPCSQTKRAPYQQVFKKRDMVLPHLCARMASQEMKEMKDGEIGLQLNALSFDFRRLLYAGFEKNSFLGNPGKDIGFEPAIKFAFNLNILSSAPETGGDRGCYTLSKQHHFPCRKRAGASIIFEINSRCNGYFLLRP